MTDVRTVGVDERAEAYLDGAMAPDDAAAFERDLASRSEVAQALAAAIALRDLLEQLPPMAPPPGLEERIVGALRLGGRARPAARDERASEEGAPAPSNVRAALSGTGWLVRPSAAVVAGGIGGARPIAAGLGQVRWLLGPLAARRAEPAPRPPLWQRVIGRLV